MAAVIRLTVLTGPHKGTRFCTRGLSACMLGRSTDCQMRICGAARDQSISRFHCQLLLDPPLVRVQDMDSSNGTYVNGHQVGHAGIAEHGDVLTVGGTSLLVHIVDCPLHFVSPTGEAELVKIDCLADCE